VVKYVAQYSLGFTSFSPHSFIPVNNLSRCYRETRMRRAGGGLKNPTLGKFLPY